MSKENKQKKQQFSWIDDNMIRLHNKPNNRSVTLNKTLSSKLVKMGLSKVMLTSCGASMWLLFNKSKGYDIKSYNQVRGKTYRPTSIIYCYRMINEICEYLKIGEGQYDIYINPKESFTKPSADYLHCEIIGTVQQKFKEDIIIHEIMQATNPHISEATDQQLCDELKKRGYSGKLTKSSTLEL